MALPPPGSNPYICLPSRPHNLTAPSSHPAAKASPREDRARTAPPSRLNIRVAPPPAIQPKDGPAPPDPRPVLQDARAIHLALPSPARNHVVEDEDLFAVRRVRPPIRQFSLPKQAK